MEQTIEKKILEGDELNDEEKSWVKRSADNMSELVCLAIDSTINLHNVNFLLSLMPDEDTIKFLHNAVDMKNFDLAKAITDNVDKFDFNIIRDCWTKTKEFEEGPLKTGFTSMFHIITESIQESV